MPRVKVVLNGTNSNPYHRLGLEFNPIPQLPRAEYTQGCLQIQKLAGPPIPDTAYIRETLKGFSEEFIQGCCDRFRPGERVAFDITFPEFNA